MALTFRVVACDMITALLGGLQRRDFMAMMERPSWLSRFAGSLRTELAVASIRSLALNVVSKSFLLLSSIFLARWLGAEGFGIYASAIAAAVVLGILAQLGIPTLVIRILPVYDVQKEWGLLRGLLRYANSVSIISSMLIAGATAAVVLSISAHFPIVQKVSLLWAAALVPIVTLSSLNASVLRGLRHVVAGQLSETLVIPGVFLLLITAWWALGDSLGLGSLGPDTAVALRLTATAVALVVGAILLLQRLPPQARVSLPEYDRSNWIRTSIPLFFLSAAAIVTTQMDVLMLVALQNNASAGIYQSAARGADLIAFSLFVVSGVVQPTIARLYELGDLRRLQTVVTAAARFAFVLALPVAVALALFAEPMLRLLFGPEFSRGAMSLVILSAAQLVNVSAGLVANILIMTGHVRDAAIGMALGAIFNVVLNAILIPGWGVEGAAFATAVSLVIWNIFLAARVKRRIGLVGGIFGARFAG